MTTADSVTPVATPVAPPTEPRAVSAPSSGWLVVAAKEFADQLLSVRFIVLFAILGLAAAFPLFIAAERIRDLAQDASGAQAVFIAMFIIGPQDFSIFGLDFTVAAFVGLTAPCSGSPRVRLGERRTGPGHAPAPRGQPIHRDAVINGKFGAALVTISIVLVSVVVMISGFGLLGWRRPHWLRGAAPHHLGGGHDPLRRDVAGLRNAPLGPLQAGGHGGPGRIRGLAARRALRPVPAEPRPWHRLPHRHDLPAADQLPTRARPFSIGSCRRRSMPRHRPSS